MTLTCRFFDGEHVTDDTGTGFVHTAPGHGRDDFEIWMAHGRELAARGIETRLPYTVDADGFLTKDAPGFTGKRVLDDRGNKGDANEAVIKALVEAGALVARGRLKHQYPHSWRSKKPLIFRNTPQWFIALDKPIEGLGGKTQGNNGGPSLREIALEEIARTQWFPAQGENRITGMVAGRPDWVVSRQRAWGVPIAIFVRKETNDILVNAQVNARIADAFEKEGADAWFAPDAGARFLAPDYDPKDFDKIDDVLDVWFDSGSTHAFTLEGAKDFPGLAGIKRTRDGGRDSVMYLEGSDQHRGWFRIIAARKLRHARARALRCGADARIRSRREGSENGQVRRQCRGAADGYRAIRRRYSALLGRGLGLFRRSAYRPGIFEDLRRDVSQAAQHDPLDARLAGALRRGGEAGHCCGHAGA